MKNNFFFKIFFILFAFQFSAQINFDFIQHLRQQKLTREYETYLQKISPLTSADTAAWLNAHFYLQQKNPTEFLKYYSAGAKHLDKDSNAINTAAFLLLRHEVAGRKNWFQTFPKEKAPSYFLFANKFYEAVNNPLNADSTAIPEKFSSEFKEYKKYYKRKPFTAGLLSAMVPGLGKLYAGRKKSFTFTLVTHIIFAVRTIETVKVLGWKNPWTIFNLGFSGAFYFANIYGSFSDMKKIKKERRTQLLIHGSEYYNYNCACSVGQ